MGSPGSSASYEHVGLAVNDILTVQLLAAWVQYTLYRRSQGSGIMWIPQFRKTVKATWRAHVLECAVVGGSQYLLMQVMTALALGEQMEKESWSLEDLQREIRFTRVGITLCLFATIDFLLRRGSEALTFAIIIRTHASMLEDKETVVPINRDFGFQAARERGYITLSEACKSLSWATWYRIGILYVQIMAVYACCLGARVLCNVLYVLYIEEQLGGLSQV